jgi:hypothetical protein
MADEDIGYPCALICTKPSTSKAFNIPLQRQPTLDVYPKDSTKTFIYKIHTTFAQDNFSTPSSSTSGKPTGVGALMTDKC